MIESDLISEETRKALNSVAKGLAYRFKGVFSLETIEDMVFDSYIKRAATATVTRWLIVGTERFARERLEALAHTANRTEASVPAVLFLCTHNAGRSQMALGWFKALAGSHANAWSGGSEPASEINSGAVEAMAEVGVDISEGFPKPWTDEVFGAADIVITMGCGDACPLVSDKQYEDWDVADPEGLQLSAIRPIRDDLGKRVRDLLARLQIPVTDARVER
jgi:arsenate reductase (thioredoxin)